MNCGTTRKSRKAPANAYPVDRSIFPHGVDLRAYDVIVVNSSAGKDSQAMLHYVATLATAFGVLDRVVVAHAELEEEWQGTKDLVAEHAAAYGLPVYYMKRPQGSLLEHVAERGLWPSNGSRFCTSDHKRAQVAKVITDLATKATRRLRRPARVLNCIGIRRAESTKRGEKTPLALDARQTGKGTAKIVTTWYPIFELSLEEVWSTIAIAGTRPHRAYALGMPRLSCVFCVFAPKPALMLAGRHNRALLDRYVEVEEKIAHSFTKKLRIADVRDALDRGEEPGPITTWEM